MSGVSRSPLAWGLVALALLGGMGCLIAGRYPSIVATAAPGASSVQTHNPPNSFRGIKWDSPVPPLQTLRETAFKGCAAFVDQAISDAPICEHDHIDNDNSYAQGKNVAPMFGLPVSAQLLTWRNNKFDSGTIFIHNYKELDLVTINKYLLQEYGPPTFTNEDFHVKKWRWPEKRIEVSFYFNPVAKPPLGAKGPPATTATVSFARTQ